MSFKARFCLVLFALFLASYIASAVQEDPELKVCTHQCKAQQRAGKQQKEICIQRCEKYVREKHRREEGGGSGGASGEREKHEGGGGEERRPEEWGGEREKWGEEEEEEEGGEQEREGENPYVFEDRHFITGVQSQHGRVRILQKFTDRSELLRGIENYRVTILEADPQTFIVPNHWDADTVIFVANGEGTASLVHQDHRESFNIKQGDIFQIKAGTTWYLINRHNKERLVLAKLLRPISRPGHFEFFFTAGGQNPQTVYAAFSKGLSEAFFNTRWDRLQRLFEQQKQGVIIRASQEQIRAMSQHEEGGIWPFGGESKGKLNIYEQRPTHSNQYGQLYEVDSSHFRHLQDLDVAVSLANITQGAMTAPLYNSRATKIIIVVDGDDDSYFEMACPHLARLGSHQGGSQWERPGKQREATSGPRYQRVSSRLRRGTVVVVPAGHPFVAVASKNQNLQLLCFEVNAQNNEKFALAGKRNVINQLEREAKELAFGLPAREVDEVFRSQQEEFFFKGPRQQHEGYSDA